MRRGDRVRAALRLLDQRHVPGVERAHRRHQRELAGSASAERRARQFFTVTNDLHAAGASGKLRDGRRLHWRRGKDQA